MAASSGDEETSSAESEASGTRHVESSLTMASFGSRQLSMEDELSNADFVRGVVIDRDAEMAASLWSLQGE